MLNIPLLLLSSVLTLVAPDNGATFEAHSPCVIEFLANSDKRSVRPEEPPLSENDIKARDAQNAKYEAWVKAGSDKKTRVKKWERRYNFYERNAWTEDLFKRCEKETQTWKPFAWTADFPVKAANVEFSESADFASPLVERLSGKDGKDVLAMRPGFLKLGTKYFWRVRAKDAAGKDVVSDVRTFTTTGSLPRMIGIPSFNMRDLGGGKNADGREVRQGLIFRGQAPGGGTVTLDELKEFFVNKLGVRTELDLRAKEEAEESERKYAHYLLNKIGLKYFNNALWPYHMDLPENRTKIIDAVRYFADESNYPIYFHCAVGSDRTGTIGCLLDGIIGRTDEQIFNNYELPSLNYNLPRLRYCRKGSGMFGFFAPKTSKFGGATMRENIVKYLLASGITQAEIDTIRRIMLK
jgi:hypothetical protein